MNKELIDKVTTYVNENIGAFHTTRIAQLKKLKLEQLLRRKNPYLYKAKNLNTPQAVVENIASAYMSSAEETMFGDWLEGLAIFIAGYVYRGYKSSAEGMDLEMTKDGIHYFVSIKSGPNWSNSSSLKKLKENFIKAAKIYHTSGNKERCEGIEGCCYGKDLKPLKTDGHNKYCGQVFWKFISGEENLYTEIIEPLGTNAIKMNVEYKVEYDRMITRFSLDFANHYADENGNLLWDKIIALNSGYPENFDMAAI